MNRTERRAVLSVASDAEEGGTLPAPVREKLSLDTPGRVRFVENDRGEVVVEPVPRPSEFRGALAADDSEAGATPGTDRLYESRRRETADGRSDDGRLSSTEGVIDGDSRDTEQ